MKRTILTLILMFTISLATGGNDIWQNLFKEKLQEAKEGNSSAQFDVAGMYQNGRGVKPDLAKAIEWYKKSAAQNYSKAVTRLKLLEANEERFKKVLAKAEKGDAESQYKLGKMYAEGVGVSMDNAKSTQAFESAAEQGHAKAEYNLGLRHYEGIGVKRNRTTAYKWFKAAAEQNDPAAQYYLGKMFAAGSGVKQNYKTSLEWFTKSVDGGFNQARGEMIDVSERMKMQKAEKAKPAPVKKAVVKKAEPAPVKKAVAKKAEPAAVKKAVAKKSKPATAKKVVAKKSKPAAAKKVVAKKSKPVKAKKVVAKKAKPAKTKTAEKSQEFSLDDLMVAAWSRNNKPVPYLPSSINKCRTEESNIICYSDSQTRESGSNTVEFKTKSIMQNFSKDGTFKITYRNLVINSTPIAGTEISEEDDGEVGDDDNSAGSAYQVKTGWGKEHALECQLKDTGTVSCLKDKSHAILLVSKRTVAGK
jgi:TPR repeat protein